ncbi:MAG: hypothetical protein JWQ09_1783 [Segetibacter sp.]|nr:hypothetical protein [Segetibacter sp.]
MAKHKYISSPRKLWELFCEYRTLIKDNPAYQVEQKKGTVIIPKGATISEIREATKATIELPLQRPLIMQGFENYCAEQGIINDLKDYFSNKDNRYSEYTPICLRIRNTIIEDHLTGGIIGIYNPSIIQRICGLTEKTDITTDGQSLNNYNVTLNLGGPNTNENLLENQVPKIEFKS